MTLEQLREAKVLEETELPGRGSLVLLDLRSIGIVNVFPQFAVYEKRGESFLYIAGGNEERAAWEAFKKAREKHREKQRQ